MSDSKFYSKRRSFLRAATVGISFGLSPQIFAQETGVIAKTPDSKTFQSGDLIWPKRPGEFVPYNSGTVSPYDEEKLRWINERRAFVDKVRSNPKSSQELRQLAADLSLLDFNEFLTLYQADQTPGTPREYGGGATVLYVGHVGVISIEDGEPTVVEALWGKGVVQSKYESWLINRPGAWVWHGRVANRSQDERALIAVEAKKYLQRPYNFWNFDLADASGFYCSKLCWLAIRDALNLAVDDNPNPSRPFWFSPKQLLKARRVEKLFVPGSYTF